MEKNLGLKVDWASLIAGGKFTIFALFYFVFDGNFPNTSPRGAYIWRGDLVEGFLCYWFGGLIFGGAYTWRGLFSEFYSILPLSFLYYEYVSNLMHDINNNNTPLNILKLFQKTPSIHTALRTIIMRISTSVNFYVQSTRLEIHKRYFSRFGVKL